jgi:hypothetical protein
MDGKYVRNLMLTLCLSDHESGVPAAISQLSRHPTPRLRIGTRRGRLRPGRGPARQPRQKHPPETPLHNPAFVLRNWRERGVVGSINGKTIPPNRNLHAGHLSRLDGSDLVAWLQLTASETPDVALRFTALNPP